jgi:hypothetical protein
MVEQNSEKNLGAMIAASLVDEFTEQVDQRGYKIKRALAAAVKLWKDLPEEIQARLLNQSLASNGLGEIVQKIVEERIETGRKVARKSLERPRKKRDQKD